jgi:ABC-type transport system involved in multi-copper enzyme maturation permease subunit
MTVTSEWIKLRSVRSTYWVLAASVLLLVGTGISPALGVALSALPAGEVDGTGGALSGITGAQLVVGLLAVLAVTSEYSTGTIRSTLAAVPRRLPVLLAKAVVVSTVIAVVGLVTVLVTHAVARALLAGAGVSVSLGDPGTLRAVLGSALYLTVVGVLGLGLGWLLRSTAGALSALFGVLFVLPVVGLFAPAAVPYLPGNAGAAVMQVGPEGGLLPPWLGLRLFAGYALLTLGAGALALVRRDA